MDYTAFLPVHGFTLRINLMFSGVLAQSDIKQVDSSAPFQIGCGLSDPIHQHFI